MARKINVKLVLELHASGLSRNTIASSRHMSRHSVSDVLQIADEKGITYDSVRSLPEEDVYRLFYPDKHIQEVMYETVDYDYVHSELKKTGVTLKLLWEEYKDKSKAVPMGYTKYCEGYHQYTIANRLTNHLEHKPGDRCEVDWSGPTMHIVDDTTGEVITAYLFVGVLPYSQYTYVEPCLDMKMDTFLRCHVHMYEYFGGVPTRTVCDNLKTGVVKHPREGEIVLTEDYEALGNHYMTAIMPTGVRKPKQKASVEGAVGKIATAIIARLRGETFYSLESLRRAILQELKAYNQKKFQKREGSRAEVLEEEKAYLRPLPSLPYEIATWVYGRAVGLDFHVIYKKNRYSCPYQYAEKKMDLRITDTSLEIYHKGSRVTTHNRFPDYVQNKYSTHEEDMPPAFRKVSAWDDVRIRNWADKIGPNTREAIERIFSSVKIKEQGYNAALAVLRLSKSYSNERLETACEVAFSKGARSPRYRQLKAILAANQDKQYTEQRNLSNRPKPDSLGYLRGADYYRDGGGSDA